MFLFVNENRGQHTYAVANFVDDCIQVSDFAPQYSHSRAHSALRCRKILHDIQKVSEFGHDAGIL